MCTIQLRWWPLYGPGWTNRVGSRWLSFSLCSPSFVLSFFPWEREREKRRDRGVKNKKDDVYYLFFSHPPMSTIESVVATKPFPSIHPPIYNASKQLDPSHLRTQIALIHPMSIRWSVLPLVCADNKEREREAEENELFFPNALNSILFFFLSFEKTKRAHCTTKKMWHRWSPTLAAHTHRANTSQGILQFSEWVSSHGPCPCAYLEGGLGTCNCALQSSANQMKARSCGSTPSLRTPSMQQGWTLHVATWTKPKGEEGA